jgi:Fe-S oxidoreductase
MVTILQAAGINFGILGAEESCCGGGGHMWMEEEPSKRVNARRVEEIIQAKVGVVATACPYCLTMLEDGVKAKGVEETLHVNDLSELVAEALGKDG